MHFFGILLLSVIDCQAQSANVTQSNKNNFICNYELTYRPDSTSQSVTTEIIRLKIGDGYSESVSLNYLTRDSLIKETASAIEQGLRNQKMGMGPAINQFNPNGLPSTRYKTNFREFIYKNHSNYDVTTFEKISNTLYSFEEPKGLFSWKITPEMKTIAGFSCQRATTAFGGRQWEAWFTREVSIPEGPYKFYGLPGLIVAVADTRGNYKFTLIKLANSPTPLLISPPHNAVKVSKMDFLTAKSTFKRSQLERLNAAEPSKMLPPEQLQRMRSQDQDRLRRENNPLERK